MKVMLFLCVCVTAMAAAATAGAGSTVRTGTPCTIGLPSSDNQGVFLTTTKSVTVIGDNGVAVTHCTFTQTDYTSPLDTFPFNCNIEGTPADVTELHIAPDHTVSLTCVAHPNG